MNAQWADPSRQAAATSRRQAAIGAGDDGAGGDAWPIGGGEPTGVRRGQRLEDHDLGEQPGTDAAERLGEVETAEREAVEHGEHRRRPAPGRLVLADVGRELAATEPFGRRTELLQLGRELEATHLAHPSGTRIDGGQVVAGASAELTGRPIEAALGDAPALRFGGRFQTPATHRGQRGCRHVQLPQRQRVEPQRSDGVGGAPRGTGP